MPAYRRLLYCLISLMLLALPGAGRAAGRDQLTIGIAQFPANFHPLNDEMMAKAYILDMAQRPLTTYDKDWKLVCLLCVQLPTIENGGAVVEPLPGGKKGMAITYSIQPQAQWGDGVPVSAEDLVFTWEVGKHPQSGVTNGESFRRILSIDVRDPKTVVLHLDRVTYDYNDLSDLSVLPAHLERKAFAVPAEYKTRSLYETDTTNPGLYNGPYRITQVARGQYVVLEPNPHWWGAKPAFQRIIVKSIESSPALEANLLSGGIDMIAGEIGMTMDAALAFEAQHHRPEWVVVYKPGLSYEHFSINMDNPILGDRRVRQALLLGLDRETLVRQVFQGKQVVANGEVNPLDSSYDPNVVKYPFDPDRAGALLDQAGWPKGSDGQRRNAKGEKLSVEVMTTAGMRVREVMELVAQQNWRKLGIDVTLRNQPARVLFGEAVLKHAFPSLALFAWISSPEQSPRLKLHSAMIPTSANNFAGENAGGYKNPEMDRLIDTIEKELDRDKRRALWAQQQALYAEDLPELPLTFLSNPFVLPVWLKGVEPTGHQFPTTLWVENWRAE